MKPETKSILIFLLLCLPARIYIASYAKQNPKNKLLPILGLFVSFNFFYIYFNKLRKYGIETFGKPIWWNNLRPVHAILYFCFAYSSYMKSENAYKFLAADAAIGLAAFLKNHFI